MGEERAFVFRLNDHGQGPELIQQVFLERGWKEFDEDEMDETDWNLWWRTSRFRNSDYDQIYQWQRLNHYPKSTAITKKDSLARNLKRMKGVYGSSVYNFSPTAFNLPNDYTKFVSDYTKMKEKAPDKTLYWICKPADLSRGRGIFIFRELSELQYDCNAVVQQYITNPMLIAGYKFDLRIYVLVPSFHPLSIYIYQEGLVRFSTEKYDLTHLGNMFAHLTNTSINKHSPTYGVDKERVGPGCKWTITQLRHFFHQANIDDQVLWTKIINIVILTLIIQANQVPKTANCFELYGFDVMIDENLKPWLLEVNFSPALSSDCQTDLIVKKPMLHDLVDAMCYREHDKIRGGAEFRTRQSHIEKNLHSSSSVPKSGRGRKSASRLQQNRKTVGRLPDITNSNSNLATYSQKRHRYNQAQSSRYDDYEGEGEEDIVPIIPGCGLPSVQQPLPRPPSSSSSGRSSAGSNISNNGDNNKMFVKRRGGASPSSSVAMTHRSTKSQPPLHRTNSNRSWKLDVTDTRPASQRIVKRDSKNSTNSDSAISSYSGSSDNSDILPNNDETNARNSTALPPGAHGGLRKTREHLFSTPQKAKPTKNHSVGSSGALTNKSGIAKINSVINYEADSRNGAISTSISTSPNRTSTRKTVPPNPKRYSSMSYTANPLHTKSALLNRRSSVTSVSGSQNSRHQGYVTPWLRTKSTPSSLSPEKSGLAPCQRRYGGFVLVFPFNDALRRCAKGSLDARVVIRECQKLLKEKTGVAQEEKAGRKEEKAGRKVSGEEKAGRKISGEEKVWKRGEEYNRMNNKPGPSVSDMIPVWGALTVEPEIG